MDGCEQKYVCDEDRVIRFSDDWINDTIDGNYGGSCSLHPKQLDVLESVDVWEKDMRGGGKR